MTDPLDQLRLAGEELRQVFADERHAIATLDHARLEALATSKHELARRLEALREPALATRSPAVHHLFEAIRVEARATAMLAAMATEAVRALLGYDTSGGYDRRARCVTQGPSRILAAL